MTAHFLWIHAEIFTKNVYTIYRKEEQKGVQMNQD